MTPYTTEILARFVLSRKAGQFPHSALDSAKKCLLDLFAAAAAGRDSSAGKAVLDVSRKCFLPGESLVWFSREMLCAAGATYANAAFASALDLDDGHRAAMGHPGAGIIPAALAVAQETRAGGKDLLTAIVLGYEVAVRIAAARDHTRLETLSTGKWCGYGVAAACGWLRRMTPEQLSRAMTVAGVQAPGLSAAGYSGIMGNSAKEGIPWAALTGLFSLDLAEKGFTGPTDILDHPDYYDARKITADLGKRFAITSVYFKPYACCRWIHGALDALSHVMTDNALTAADIEKIEVHTFDRALRLTNETDPATLEGAQYSLPYCLAILAVEGRDVLLPMRADLLHRKDISGFAEKIKLTEDPELTRGFPGKAAARVWIVTNRGTFEKQVDDPKGDPANPMDFQEIEAKFHRLVETAGFFPAAAKVPGAVKNIESGGVEALVDVLRQQYKSYIPHPKNSIS